MAAARDGRIWSREAAMVPPQQPAAMPPRAPDPSFPRTPKH
jgi:hypothetical protein